MLLFLSGPGNSPSDRFRVVFDVESRGLYRVFWLVKHVINLT
jgi:hypothetical protein